MKYDSSLCGILYRYLLYEVYLQSVSEFSIT